MNTLTVPEIITNSLSLMGVSLTSLETEIYPEINTTIYTITTDSDELFLEKSGEGLRALNYLIRKMKEHTHGEVLNESFVIDIGAFQKKIIQSVKTKATIVANRVRSFKRDVALEPMPPYERLMVHSFLADAKDITTESVGIGKDRHVVVKYQENTDDILTIQ
jgi:spoIIIJ-associated protein